MPRIQYVVQDFREDTMTVIEHAQQICAEYNRQGYDLTLRQLYYQFVARGLIPNTDRSYKRLGDIVSKARMAGLLDWSYIVDRTRNLSGTSHWTSVSSIVNSAAHSYRADKWIGQPYRVEVWVEKEALAGVIERAASAVDVDWFSCRGYVSLSEMWEAGRRFRRYLDAGQDVIVLHLGDHDPSGLDMTADITNRLGQFVGRDAWRLEVRRIALNLDQVRQYNPPPNPAKLTDSRGARYVEEYGEHSWELDALDPATLNALIVDEISGIVDQAAYDEAERVERLDRDRLERLAERWDDIAPMLDDDEEE